MLPCKLKQTAAAELINCHNRAGEKSGEAARPLPDEVSLNCKVCCPARFAMHPTLRQLYNPPAQ